MPAVKLDILPEGTELRGRRFPKRFWFVARRRALSPEQVEATCMVWNRDMIIHVLILIFREKVT